MMALVFLLVALSGFSGLVYEVLWAKQLILALGNTALAHTMILCVFMGGLSIGNAVLGARADRTPVPLRLYGLLELGIGLFGFLSPWLLQELSDVYVALAGGGVPALVAVALRTALCALALLPPAVLMGGTLPALSRFRVREISQTEGAISRLYACNSAGASLGALLAGFWLVPAFGLNVPVYAAAAVNGIVGVCALLLARAPQRAPEVPMEDVPRRKNSTLGAGPRRVLAAAVFVSGFVALAYEIAWIRLLAVVLGSSAYSFALMLSAFIAGLALGSFVMRRTALPRLDAYSLFGAAQAGIGLSVLLTLPLYGRLTYFVYAAATVLQRTSGAFYLSQAFNLLLCFLLMLPPTVFMGMSLPLAGAAAARSVSRVGAEVGRIFSWNALGNVLGAFAAGLFLLPALGIEGLVGAGIALNVLTACAVLGAGSARAAARAAAVGGVLLAAVLGWLVARPNLDKLVLSVGEFRGRPYYAPLSFREYQDKFKKDTLLYYKDDRDATITVLKENGELFLKTNGKTDASLWADRNTEVLSAHIPLLLKPASQDVLIVGLGSGKTAGSVLQHPVARLDLVEISRAVVEADRFFLEHNHHPLEDPRLRLHLDDAKTYLRLDPRRHDIIISEPSNPWIAGTGNLFSVDFYDVAKSRLKPGGLMVQWFHTYEMTDETFALILRTFCSQFQHVLLWEIPPSKGDVLLIGSQEPLKADFERSEATLKAPAVAAELAQLGISRLPTILSLQSASNAAARALAGSGRVNEDQFPILEYEAPKALFLRAVSGLLYTKDQRQSYRGVEPLLMSRYLEERRRPLSAEEFRELASFHGNSRGIMERPFLYEWARRYPEDARPRWILARLDRDAGDAQGARDLVEEMLRRRPNDGDYLDLAAKIEFDLFLQHRSYLTEGSPKKCLGYLVRLAAATSGARKVEAYQKIAEIYANTGSLEDAQRFLARAALTAAKTKAGPSPDSLWVAGARMALDRGRNDVARGCLAKALKLNPGNQDAASLRLGLGP